MRIRTVGLVAVLIIGTIGVPVAGLAGAQQSEVTLTVTVLTAAGDPVSDAELTVTWTDGSETGTVEPKPTTASNGQALVDVPEGAEVTIEVDHPGYVRNEPFTLSNASEGAVQVTVYQRSAVSLSVVDEDGPVEDVRVVLRKAGSIVEVFWTDARGEIESGDIEAGEYALTLSKPGYFREVMPLTVRGDTSEEVTLESGSVSVEFLVLDENFDPPRPVPEATITGEDFSVSTGSDGRREVSLPVNTELTITVEKAGYDTIERTIEIHEQPMQLNLTTLKQPAVRLDVSNERVVVGETLQVTVTDQYGEPLPGATVYLDGVAVGEANSQGTLQVPIESQGEHTVSAQLDQLSSERLTVTGIASAGDGDEAPESPSSGDEIRQPSGFLDVPRVGLLHLRSMTLGMAAGLVLATLVFVYARLR